MRKSSVKMNHVTRKAAVSLAIIVVAALAEIGAFAPIRERAPRIGDPGVGLVRGQQRVPAEARATVSFHPVSELTEQPGAQPTLRGARLATPEDWPASFYAVFVDGSCTASMVGPRALLTAAHCVPNRGSISLILANKTYKGTCTQSDLYSIASDDGLSADWALCLMQSDVPVRKYEVINMDPARIAFQTELLLTGFGCTQKDGVTSYDGNYRIGEAKITKLPRGKNNDIITSGEAALCFGDSGGGAFLFLDAGKKKRVQVSVNSRVGQLKDKTLTNDSHLSSLSTSAAQAFLQQWASKNGASICGLTSDAKTCQN